MGIDLSRRAFIAVSAATPILTLDKLLCAQSKDEELWEKAASDIKNGQKALDRTLESSPEHQELISRFYAVYLEPVRRPSRKPFALEWKDSKLKFCNYQIERRFRDDIKRHAESYAKSQNLVPGKLQKETETAHRNIVAEIVDLAKEVDADVYRSPFVWGHDVPSIGIVTDKFFESSRYKTAEDRKSKLLDYLGKKAEHQRRNPLMSQLCEGSRLHTNVSAIWTKGATTGMHVLFEAALENRWFNAQAQKILGGERKVSDEYLQSIAQEWQNSEGFKHLVERHLKYSDRTYNNEEVGRYLSDSMGKRWGFTCLPFEGKIVPYSKERVKQYKFDE